MGSFDSPLPSRMVMIEGLTAEIPGAIPEGFTAGGETPGFTLAAPAVPVTVVVPVNVLLPLRSNVPLPVLVRLPLPLATWLDIPGITVGRRSAGRPAKR